MQCIGCQTRLCDSMAIDGFCPIISASLFISAIFLKPGGVTVEINFGLITPYTKMFLY